MLLINTYLSMKKFIFVFLIAFSLNAVKSNAQFSTAPDGITVKRVLMDFYTPIDEELASFDKLKNSGGVEIGYYRHLNEWFNVGVPIRVGTARLADGNKNFGSAKLNVGADLVVQLKYFKPKKFIAPYLVAGVGSYFEDWADARVDIPLGMGLNFRLAPLVYANVQTEYRHSLTDNRSNLAHSAGLLFLIGDEMKDRDKDGVADDLDSCPDVFGLAQFNGCPDADMDGVPEPTDACPNDPGLVSLNGCPDVDGDGVTDKKDNCPDVAGLASLGGCPDGDGDGIADKDDACPTQKGKKDLKGCPDKDNDGVADQDDKCPDVPGVKENAGCPADRDKDGVADKDDKCPDKAGNSAMNGCPDTDGDGVADNVDRCPEKPGPASNKGCPEMKAEEKKKLETAARAIQFETGSAVIKKDSYKILDDVVGLMNNYSEYSCDIAGHTDNVSADAFNLSLSQKRAKACLDYLVKNGVSAMRITSEGFGEAKPVGDNKTASGRKLNRRTEFLMTVK